MLFASYDELLEDKIGYIRKICDFCDIKVSDERLIKVINECGKDKQLTNFNKGVSGRGLKELSEKQVARIREIAGYYAGVDLSAIGL